MDNLSSAELSQMISDKENELKSAIDAYAIIYDEVHVHEKTKIEISRHILDLKVKIKDIELEINKLEPALKKGNNTLSKFRMDIEHLKRKYFAVGREGR